jgi:hypothetical protein
MKQELNKRVYFGLSVSMQPVPVSFVPVSFVAGRGVGAIDCRQSTSFPVHQVETIVRCDAA